MYDVLGERAAADLVGGDDEGGTSRRAACRGRSGRHRVTSMSSCHLDAEGDHDGVVALGAVVDRARRRHVATGARAEQSQAKGSVLLEPGADRPPAERHRWGAEEGQVVAEQRAASSMIWKCAPSKLEMIDEDGDVFPGCRRM